MPAITGSTRVFWILGDPLFQRHGVDAVVVPLQVSAAALPGWLEHGMQAGKVGGFRATIPHKPMLAQLLRPADPVAAIAGAANAVRRHADGRLEAALFDGIGFVKGLDHFGIEGPGRCGSPCIRSEMRAPALPQTPRVPQPPNPYPPPPSPPSPPAPAAAPPAAPPGPPA
ncbi:hypothetical protein [Azohydromonas aeria]|uniref:hypothetical protein n=1 Tax=Azohydromonas aeria TaxID=2590212 RepID=UPI0012FCD63C|nr:hypothetical protein [Azohydromonas aeria]